MIDTQKVTERKVEAVLCPLSHHKLVPITEGLFSKLFHRNKRCCGHCRWFDGKRHYRQEDLEAGRINAIHCRFDDDPISKTIHYREFHIVNAKDIVEG